MDKKELLYEYIIKKFGWFPIDCTPKTFRNRVYNSLGFKLYLFSHSIHETLKMEKILKLLQKIVDKLWLWK